MIDDPPQGFFNNSQSITVALMRALPRGIPFELVHSGLGACYVRFRTHAAREAAMELPAIMHEDVRITLEREEEAQRVPLKRRSVCSALGLAAGC
jgi:organic hydroperoxide reductase OsmC/OhrA